MSKQIQFATMLAGMGQQVRMMRELGSFQQIPGPPSRREKVREFLRALSALQDSIGVVHSLCLWEEDDEQGEGSPQG